MKATPDRSARHFGSQTGLAVALRTRFWPQSGTEFQYRDGSFLLARFVQYQALKGDQNWFPLMGAIDPLSL